VSPSTAPDRAVSANQFNRLIIRFLEHKPASRRVFRRKATLRSYSPEERRDPAVSSAAGYVHQLILHSDDEGQARVLPLANFRGSRNSSAETGFDKNGETALDEAQLTGNGLRRALCLESGSIEDSPGDQQKLAVPNRGLP
jgi:hypothetical protein